MKTIGELIQTRGFKIDTSLKLQNFKQHLHQLLQIVQCLTHV